MRKDKIRYWFIVLILVVSLFPSFLYVKTVKAESSFGYTQLETLKMYNASITPSLYFDGANHIFITPFGNYTLLQPGNIMSFTDYSGELVIEKSVFVLQYDNYGSWLPLLDFTEKDDVPIVYQANDTYYDFRYNIYDKKTIIASVKIEFIVDGLNKPKISVSMNRTQDWEIEFGGPDFRWIWDVVPYVDEYGDGWKYWKNSTEIVDITQISGTQELGNLTRLQFTDNSSISLSSFLDVSDYGATIFEGGDETYWNTKGFVAVFPVNEENIDPFTYSEELNNFNPSSYGSWVEYDLFTLQSVPKGAVAEILCRMNIQDNERYMGIRTKGSSIDRRIQLHEAESGGCTTSTMLVKTDATDGKIELYGEVAGCQFSLLGYYEGLDFTEKFTYIGSPPIYWNDKDLTSYGVPANAVLQILIANNDPANYRDCGIRENGPTRSRWLSLDEAEGGGLSCISMIVKADSNKIIEWYSGGTGNVEMYILGWFGSNVDFTQGWDQYTFTGSKDDSVWQTKTITEADASSVTVWAMTHSDAGVETDCGIRTQGSSIERRIQEHEAEGGGFSGFQASVVVDASKQVEIYCGDSSESFFYYSGFFTEIAGGEQYYRDVSQGIGWSGVAYRSWDARRDFTQGISLSSDSGKTWTLTRAFTQSLTFSSSAFEDLMQYILIQVSQSIAFTPDSLRTWSLSRTFSQGLSFASTTERFVQFMRNPLQGITASVEAFRSWTLTRTFSLPMILSSNAIVDIFKAFQRTLTLGIQLSSDAFREWSLSRAFTQGLALTSLTDRNWSLIRIATQSLTANIEANRIVSAIRQLSQNIAISSNAGRIGTFLRGLSQSITLSSETFRSWSLSRSFTQGISLASSIWTHLTVGAEQFLRTLTLSMSLSTESTRTWNLARTLTQGLSFTSLSGRSWSLIRVAIQSLTANVATNRILSAIRQASQNIALSSNVERLVSFTRGLSQSISLSSESFRTWNLSRSFTQGLSIISSIFIKLTEYIPDPPDPEEFFRAVSLGIELASSNIRQWSLTRIFSQGISFSSNIWTKLYTNVIRRVATLYLSLASNTDLSMRIVNEFNFAYIAVVSLGIIFTVIYFLYDKHYQVGILAFGSWFVSAAMNQYLQPDLYPISFFFAGLALMHVLLLMMDYAGANKVDFWN